MDTLIQFCVCESGNRNQILRSFRPILGSLGIRHISRVSVYILKEIEMKHPEALDLS